MDNSATEPAVPAVLAVCGLDFEGAIAAGPGVVTVRGPGPARVEAGLEALLSRAPSSWAGIISFGCVGALDPGLAAGTCVVATGVLTRDEVMPADAAWVRALLSHLPGAWPGKLAGIDVPLVSGADKIAMWRDCGACAVDMESHAAALVARRHGLPFAACRVVLDPAWRNLPPCALAGVREDGSAALWPLLRVLGRAPGELAPLSALALDAWRARRALRQVRARLGPRLAAPGP
jgi:hopanoid-associated phosphorylase